MGNETDYVAPNDIDIDLEAGDRRPLTAQRYVKFWQQALLFGEEVAKGMIAGAPANYTGGAVTQFAIINTLPGLDTAAKAFAGISLALTLSMTYSAFTTSRNYSNYFLPPTPDNNPPTARPGLRSYLFNNFYNRSAVANTIGAAFTALFLFQAFYQTIPILMGGADGARYYGGVVIGQFIKYLALDAILKAIAPFGHYIADMDGKEIKLGGRGTAAHAATYLVLGYPAQVMWPVIVFGQQRIAAGEHVVTVLGIPTDLGGPVPPGKNPLYKVSSTLSKVTKAALNGEFVNRGFLDRGAKQIDLMIANKGKYQIVYRPVNDALKKLKFLPTLGKPETYGYGFKTGMTDWLSEFPKSAVSRFTLWSAIGSPGPATQARAVVGPSWNAVFQLGSSAGSKPREKIWEIAGRGAQGKYYWEATPSPEVVPLIDINVPMEVHGAVNGQSSLASLKNLGGEAGLFSEQDVRRCFLGLLLENRTAGTLANTTVANPNALTVNTIRNADDNALDGFLQPGNVHTFTLNTGEAFSMGPGVANPSGNLMYAFMRMYSPDTQVINRGGVLGPVFDQEWANYLTNNGNRIGSAVIHFQAPGVGGVGHDIAVRLRENRYYLVDPTDHSLTLQGQTNGWQQGTSSDGAPGSSYRLPGDTHQAQLGAILGTLPLAYFQIVDLTTHGVEMLVSRGVPLRINLDQARFPFIPPIVPGHAIGGVVAPPPPPIQNAVQNPAPGVIVNADDGPVIAVYGQADGQSSLASFRNLGGQSRLLDERIVRQGFLGLLLESRTVGTLTNTTVANPDALTANGILNADDAALDAHLPPGNVHTFTANGETYSMGPGVTNLSGNLTSALVRIYLPDTRAIGPRGLIDTLDQPWAQHLINNLVESAVIHFEAPDGTGHDIALTLRRGRNETGPGRFYLTDSVDRSQTEQGYANGWRQGISPDGYPAGSFYRLRGDTRQEQQASVPASLRALYRGVIDLTTNTVEVFASRGRPLRLNLDQTRFNFIPHDGPPGPGGGRGLGGPGNPPDDSRGGTHFLGRKSAGRGRGGAGFGGGFGHGGAVLHDGMNNEGALIVMNSSFVKRLNDFLSSQLAPETTSKIEELPEDEPVISKQPKISTVTDLEVDSIAKLNPGVVNKPASVLSSPLPRDTESRVEELPNESPVIPSFPRTSSFVTDSDKDSITNSSILSSGSTTLTKPDELDSLPGSKRNAVVGSATGVTQNGPSIILDTERSDSAVSGLDKETSRLSLPLTGLTNQPLYQEPSSIDVEATPPAITDEERTVPRRLGMAIDENPVKEEPLKTIVISTPAERRQQFLEKAAALFTQDDSTKTAASPDQYIDRLIKRLVATGVIDDKTKVGFKMLRDKQIKVVMTLKDGSKVEGLARPMLTSQQVIQKKEASDSLFSRFSINEKEPNKVSDKLLSTLTQTEVLRDFIKEHIDTITTAMQPPENKYQHRRKLSLSSVVTSRTARSGSSVTSTATKNFKKATTYITSLPRRMSSSDESSLLLSNDTVRITKPASTQKSIELFNSQPPQTQLLLAQIINDGDNKFKRWELKPAVQADIVKNKLTYENLSSGTVVAEIAAENTKIVQQTSGGTLKLCIATDDLCKSLPPKGQSIPKDFNKTLKQMSASAGNSPKVKIK